MPLSDGPNTGWTIQTGSKASGTSAITATAAAAATLTFPNAAATASLVPGSSVTLSGGSAAENVTVSAAFVPGSSATVPITGGTVVNAGQVLARYPVVGSGYSYSDPTTTAYLSTELPTASVQLTAGLPQSVWAAVSGNPANVPSIASKALSAPTIAALATDQASLPGQSIVYVRPTVGGYPSPTVNYAWGDNTSDVRNEAPYLMEHRYAADGTYTVTLTATSTQGTASVVRTATVASGTTVWS